MVDCSSRTLLHSSRKNKWTSEEDTQLRHAVRSVGTQSWHRVAKLIPSRTGKQCRERWMGQLAPHVSKDGWMPEEDALLLQTHVSVGNHWTVIAANLPGRSPISVKNRWSWLVRHGLTMEPIPQPDVIERKPSGKRALEPLAIDSSLFGSAFQEFQANMLEGHVA